MNRFLHILIVYLFIVAVFSVKTKPKKATKSVPKKKNRLGEGYRFDYEFKSDCKGWLKVQKVPATWHDARLRCHLEGAVLASPLNKCLTRTLNETAYALKYKVFTGIHATFSIGDFNSIEGVPLSKITHTWIDRNSAHYKSTHECTCMLPGGKLSDISCSRTLAYLCYRRDSRVMPIINECGTVDPEYEYYEQTGSCYKFHRVPRTWSRAFMACAAEGAHLAIINNDEEAKIIRQLFAENPAESMVGEFWKDVAFIGVHDWGEHGEWLTIEGETLEDAGYDLFAPGEPNNSTTGEFCGGVYRSAMLDDIWCDHLQPFICEKNPQSLLKRIK